VIGSDISALPVKVAPINDTSMNALFLGSCPMSASTDGRIKSCPEPETAPAGIVTVDDPKATVVE
jgi:hypothetical protein